VLAADYFFIEPFYSIDLNLAFVERTLTFGVILAVVIWFAHVRKRAEERLREQTERLQEQTQLLEAAKEELKRADRMKDEFLAVLSHELRNPLGAIRNGLYLMGDDRVKDQARVRDMMDWSRETAFVWPRCCPIFWPTGPSSRPAAALLHSMPRPGTAPL